jgi:hypothetical protein
VLVSLAPKAQAFGAEHLKPLVRAMQTATGELEEAELAAWSGSFAASRPS